MDTNGKLYSIVLVTNMRGFRYIWVTSVTADWKKTLSVIFLVCIINWKYQNSIKIPMPNSKKSNTIIVSELKPWCCCTLMTFQTFLGQAWVISKTYVAWVRLHLLSFSNYLKKWQETKQFKNNYRHSSSDEIMFFSCQLSLEI